MAKRIFVAIVAVLVVIQGLTSCAPGNQTAPPATDNQVVEPKSSAAVDNNTALNKQDIATTPDNREADTAPTAQKPAKMPLQILFLRIDNNRSGPNMIGKYDLATVSRDIWVMDFDGSNVVNLTKGNENVMSADWSPDKSKIVFEAVDSYLEGFPVCHISTMNADGSNIKRISPGASSRHFPAWSPDGNLIANSKYYVGWVQSDGTPIDKTFELFIFNQNGAKDGRVVFSPHFGYELLPRWFPDSRHVAFLDKETGFYEIWSGDITKKGDLTKYSIDSNPAYMPWFSLSPDATQIAFSHDFSQDNYRTGRELFVFNTNTGETAQLTKNDYADDNPCFSPDGRQIVFGSFGDSEKTRGIFIGDINGTNFEQLSSQYGDIPMQWK